MDISKIDTIGKSLNKLVGKHSPMIAGAPPEMREILAKETKRLLPMASQMLVLALIEGEKEVYGYEIMQLADKLDIGGITFGASKVYPMLHKMEKRGLLKSRWDGRKKVYHVTAKGKRYITWWKESLKMGITVKVKMLKLIFDEEVKI